VRAAGFVNVEIVHKYDNYVDVPDPSDALEFGTKGISFRAQADEVNHIMSIHRDQPTRGDMRHVQHS